MGYRVQHRSLPLPLSVPRDPVSRSTSRFSRLYSNSRHICTRIGAQLVACSPVNNQSSFHRSLNVLNATAESQSNVASSEKTEWAMQDFYGLRKDVSAVVERVEEVKIAIGLERLQEDISSLERKAADSSLWDDPAKAQEILHALTDVKDKIKQFNEFKSKVEEAEAIVKLTEELDSIDTGLLEEASKIIKVLSKALDRFELTQLLSGPYDKEGAVITVTAGAGGTDAQCRIGLICY